jgi:Fe-S cluster assembly iron-binding protein IscA
MLTLTGAAGDYLKSALERAKASEDTAIRIVVEDDKLAPALDTERPGDETLDYHGRTVLLLDAEVCEYLADSTLDVESTDEGLRLLILQ